MTVFATDALHFQGVHTRDAMHKASQVATRNLLWAVNKHCAHLMTNNCGQASRSTKCTRINGNLHTYFILSGVFFSNMAKKCLQMVECQLDRPSHLWACMFGGYSWMLMTDEVLHIFEHMKKNASFSSNHNLNNPKTWMNPLCWAGWDTLVNCNS